MERVVLKSGTYDNIMVLAKENGLLDAFNEEVSDGQGRGLKEYLEDYSDSPIVFRFLSDMIGSNLIEYCDWICSPVECNWKKVTITIQ